MKKFLYVHAFGLLFGWICAGRHANNTIKMMCADIFECDSVNVV